MIGDEKIIRKDLDDTAKAVPGEKFRALNVLSIHLKNVEKSKISPK